VSVFGQDSLKTRRTLKVANREYDYFSLREAESQLGDVSRLPFSLKVLLENLLRYEDGRSVTPPGRSTAAAIRKSPTGRRASCCRI
jgi:aconitate hydratase